MQRTVQNMLTAFFWGVVLFSQCQFYVLGQSMPPVAPIHNVVDDYFRTKITDHSVVGAKR